MKKIVLMLASIILVGCLFGCLADDEKSVQSTVTRIDSNMNRILDNQEDISGKVFSISQSSIALRYELDELMELNRELLQRLDTKQSADTKKIQIDITINAGTWRSTQEFDTVQGAVDFLNQYK